MPGMGLLVSGENRRSGEHVIYQWVTDNMTRKENNDHGLTSIWGICYYVHQLGVQSLNSLEEFL